MNQEFSQTVDKYSTSVFRCAYTYCNNRQDAEDIMQEVFIKYLTKKPVFADEAHEKACIDSRNTVRKRKKYVTG